MAGPISRSEFREFASDNDLTTSRNDKDFRTEKFLELIEDDFANDEGEVDEEKLIELLVAKGASESKAEDAAAEYLESEGEENDDGDLVVDPEKLMADLFGDDAEEDEIKLSSARRGLNDFMDEYA